MWQLVQFQVKRRWKHEVTVLTLIICSALFFEDISIFIVTSPLLLARSTYAYESPYFLLKHWLMMPIKQHDILKARFIYEAVSFLIFIVTFTVIMLVQGDAKALGYFTAFVIVFNVLYAQSIFVEFSTISKPSYIDYVYGIFPAAGLVIIHIILVAIETSIPSWLMALPIPLLSFLFLKRYYKKACIQIAQKDIR